MRSTQNPLGPLCAAVLVSTMGCATPEPAWVGSDPSGRDIVLSSPGASEPVGFVLLFLASDCPISNRYAPTLAELAREFASAGIDFYAVYDAPSHDEAAIEQHLQDYDLPLRPLRDEGVLRARAEASVTPEAVLVDAEGQVHYRGRIDDWYEAFDQRRPEASRHDLREALQALLQGQAAPRPWHPPVGCSLS